MSYRLVRIFSLSNLLAFIRIIAISIPIHIRGFSWVSYPNNHSRHINVLSTSLSASENIEILDGTKGIADAVLTEASDFMLSSFWSSASINTKDDSSSSPLQASLRELQKLDFEVRFGEILGKRLLQTNLIISRSESLEINGMVGVEISLWNMNDKVLLTYDQSEKKLKEAVAALGPKQRRQFKDSALEELVSELPDLKGKYEAVAVLCNLAVSPSARGSGMGTKLCNEVEYIVKNIWEFQNPKVLLNVEGENTPAVSLYKKLGYVEEVSDQDRKALRADFANGFFVEVPCSMLTLSKKV